MRALSLFVLANPDQIKAEAEAMTPLLGRIEVLASRTGLVMLPYRDTVRGADFFLGEVLAAEAHIRCPDKGVEGYAMVVGHDLERAMAAAILDAVGAAEVDPGRFEAFLAHIGEALARSELAERRAVEATRVQMDTF